jgi:hypothetical protein
MRQWTGEVEKWSPSPNPIEVCQLRSQGFVFLCASVSLWLKQVFSMGIDDTKLVIL